MENLESQGWIKNTTGECPVEEGTVIDVMYVGTCMGEDIHHICYHVKALTHCEHSQGYMVAFGDNWRLTYTAEHWYLDGIFDIGYWRLHNPEKMQKELKELGGYHAVI